MEQIPVEQGTNGHRKFFPVHLDHGHPTIDGLPEGEKPTNFFVRPATVEEMREVGTSLIAERNTPEAHREEEDWDDSGGKFKKG